MNDEAKLVAVFPMLAESDLPIKELDLNVAARNFILRSGVHTVAQLLQLTHTELASLFLNRSLPFYSEVISRLTCLAQPPKTEKKDDMYTVECLPEGFFGESKVKKFNVFQVAGIWKSEEIHTRMIAELLKPDSQFHDMGTVFLRKFVEVLHLPIPLEEIPDAEVKTEVHTDNDRRIDMVISTPSYYLPFEVKIWANDQMKQLQDYYNFAKKKYKNKKEVPAIYYLTPNGHMPGVQSKGSLTDSQIQLLSFQTHILRWLEDCMRDKTIDIPSDVLAIMQQLRDNIAVNFQMSGDILDLIQQWLSCYHVEWTECTAQYRTFTLKKEGDWEVALRIKKYYNKVKLSVICGHMEDSGNGPQINYAGSRKREKVQCLLENTFTNPQNYLKLDVDAAWDWFKKSPTASKTDFKETFEVDVFGRLNKSVQDQLCGETHKV